MKNAKFSEYYFYMNANIKGDFQICISVPLKMPYLGIFRQKFEKQYCHITDPQPQIFQIIFQPIR